MAHVKEQGPQVLGVSRSSSKPETEPEAARAGRPPVMRTPPGIWPQVSQTDMGRVVRRLRVAAEREHEESPRLKRASGG